MKIITEIVIAKPAAVVWEVVGTHFGDAHLWASSLNYSQGYGSKISDQVCQFRACEVQGMGRIKEKLLEFDPAGYALTYEVIEGFPSFIRRGVNRWSLTEKGNAARLRSSAEITPRGLIGALMAPIMKRQMSGVMRKTFEDLKFYIEHGVPHPRKRRALTPGRAGKS